MKVVLLGRPNVGKSSIFNALTRTSAALVAPQPGVTRDWREGTVRLTDELSFTLIDTAGIEEGEGILADADLTFQMSTIARNQAESADVVLFVVDGKDGLLPVDEHLAQHARGWNKPILVLLNKADVKTSEHVRWEVEGLGLGEIFPVTATHDSGFDDVKDALLPYAEAMPASAPEIEIQTNIPVDAEDDGALDIDWSKPLPLTIVGRPNAGKSTLINTLVGETRLLTGNIAGLTRESLDVEWEKDGQRYILVDTPGQRRQAKVVEELEQQSVETAKFAIRRAAVVVLVIDVAEYDPNIGVESVFHQQDITIAQQVLDAGKPLVILLNKWDALPGEDKNAAAKHLREEIDYKLFDIGNVTMLTTSGLKGRGVERLLPAVKDAYALWHQRIGTAKLNRFLEGILAERTPPLSKGQPVRLKFISQVSTCPPTYAVWGNRVNTLPGSYKRFMMNRLRSTFGLDGIPVRLLFKGNDNPYAKGKRK